jgi:threonine/homoserine/homoserine lactone efflux protein
VSVAGWVFIVAGVVLGLSSLVWVVLWVRWRRESAAFLREQREWWQRYWRNRFDRDF